MDSARGSQLSDAVCERARLSRDRRFDGRFFIGVVTTGIYCRPICPVQPPKRRNVCFFATAAAAAEAGFRPCLRCRPETSPGTPAWLGTSATVSRALRLISDGALDGGRDASVEQLAERLGVSSRHLGRLFVSHVGASPLTVAQTRRLHFAKCLIDDSTMPMTSVAMSAGFGSVRRFNACIRNTYARSPRELRKLARGGRPRAGSMALRLGYRPPYPWRSVITFLKARAITGVERVTADCYARSVSLASSIAVIEVRHVPAANQLSLSVEGASSSELMELVERVRRAFDLSANPHDTAAHLSQDDSLRTKLRRLPGVRVVGGVDAFEIAVRAILGQGVRLEQACRLTSQLCARFGRALPATVHGVTRLFPGPRELASADVSSLGVPAKRAAAIAALARAALADPELFSPANSPDAFASRLQTLPGIGPWTAQYIALRGLGEPDAFPTNDAFLRRHALERDAPLSAAELRRLAEPWRPWRGYAAMLLWSCS